MIKEVISRRFNHPEWPYPDAILIDGGKAQLNAAMVAQKHRALGKHRAKIQIIALAKREEELYLNGKHRPIKLKTTSVSLYHLLTHVRNEAHRFAITRYRRLHRKRVIANALTHMYNG